MIKILMLLLLSTNVIAADLSLTWTAPTLREDGSAISIIDHYTVYERIDNIDQTPVDTTNTSYIVTNAAVGIHQFMVSTTEKWPDGTLLEGVSSNSVSQPVSPIIKSQIGKMVITIEVIK